MDVEDHHQIDLTRQAALFVMKTRDGRRLTQTATSGIIGDVTELFQSRLEEVCHTTTTILKDAQVDGAVIESVKASIRTHSVPFEGLETEYQQNSYFKNKLGLLVSMFTCTLDPNFEIIFLRIASYNARVYINIIFSV